MRKYDTIVAATYGFLRLWPKTALKSNFLRSSILFHVAFAIQQKASTPNKNRIGGHPCASAAAPPRDSVEIVH